MPDLWPTDPETKHHYCAVCEADCPQYYPTGYMAQCGPWPLTWHLLWTCQGCAETYTTDVYPQILAPIFTRA